MYSKQECENRINELLAALSSEEQLVISSYTEYSWGWVFFYNTQEYLNGNAEAALLGNAPYIINRNTGEVAIAGTSSPISVYVTAYEKHLKETEGFTLEEKALHWSKMNRNASWF